jgi:deoxyribose-phosphate aldolase
MNIAPYFDHTLLRFDATSLDFVKLAEEAIKFGFATVCVPPSIVQNLRDTYSDSDLKICSVVGFPCGYTNTKTKIAETKELIAAGVNELDFVVNFSHLHSGRYDLVEVELDSLIKICRENSIISKVIIESGSLNYIQLEKIIEILNKFRPDYLKTSTGMLVMDYVVNTEEILKIRKKLDTEIKIKASGGIRNLHQVNELIKAGAQRLGTSSAVSIIQNQFKMEQL